MRIIRNALLILIIASVAIAATLYELKMLGDSEINAGADASGGLVLNEIMASNSTVFPDENGSFGDWIEIYNPCDTPVNLKGYSLSNDEKQPDKWNFPDSDVAPKSYIVIFASGCSITDINAPFWHTGFKLSRKGDAVILSRFGKIVDRIVFSRTPTDTSLGRSPDNKNKWVQFSHPTPGYENKAE